MKQIIVLVVLLLLIGCQDAFDKQVEILNATKTEEVADTFLPEETTEVVAYDPETDTTEEIPLGEFENPTLTEAEQRNISLSLFGDYATAVDFSKLFGNFLPQFNANFIKEKPAAKALGEAYLWEVTQKMKMQVVGPDGNREEVPIVLRCIVDTKKKNIVSCDGLNTNPDLSRYETESYTPHEPR